MVQRIDPNDNRSETHVVRERSSGGLGRTLLILALVALVLLGIAWAAGLLNVGTSGQLRTPDVEVSGGEMPSVDVETGDVSVGTRTETVEVPTIEVEKAGEAGN